MQTHSGIQIKIKPSGLLLTSKEDVASVTLALICSLKLLRADENTTDKLC